MDQINDLNELNEIEDIKGLLMELVRTQRVILARLDGLSRIMEQTKELPRPEQ